MWELSIHSPFNFSIWTSKLGWLVLLSVVCDCFIQEFFRWWAVMLDTALALSCYRTAPMWPSISTQVGCKFVRLQINVPPKNQEGRVPTVFSGCTLPRRSPVHVSIHSCVMWTWYDFCICLCCLYTSSAFIKFCDCRLGTRAYQTAEMVCI